MNYKILLVFPALLLGIVLNAQDAPITFNKVDSTLKIGKAGYRVDCRNKSFTENQLAVRPVGFESGANPVSFLMKGRVSQAQIDDLNSDGYPDLILFIYTDSAATKGTIYIFASDANKKIFPCMLPDVSLDGKVNAGYKGYDQFTLMEGSLLQKFPIYKPGDDMKNPTGGHRVLMYQLIRGEGERETFKLSRVRFYETK